MWSRVTVFASDEIASVLSRVTCYVPVIKRNRVTIVSLLVTQSKYLVGKESINIAKKLKAPSAACNEADIERQLLSVSC